MTTISISEDKFGAIEKHLRRKTTEQVVFLFMSERSEKDATIFEVVDYYPVPSEELVWESEYHAEVSEKVQARVIKMAWEKALSLGEIHTHPRDSGDAEFSPSDLAGFAEFVPHIWWRLKGKPYVAIVFGKKSFDAIAWTTDPRSPVGIDSLRLGQREHFPTGATIQMFRGKQEEERIRYSRQTPIFGDEGQQKITKTRVVIVGLGGLGSHVAQQLAYLGVKHFTLVDEDTVSRSNLNRLIGATEHDIDRKKVEVLSRLINAVQPDGEVRVIGRSLLSSEAFDAVRHADIVFGCVDDDGIRLVLLELCCAYQRPYIDAATDAPGGVSFGGRVVFTGLGKGCTMCRQELDQEEIRACFETPEQRRERERIYGIERSALGESGPSVVSLNGIVASTAVIEFMAFETNLRQPFPYLVYRGDLGVVTRPSDQPHPNCYYCEGLWSRRESLDPYRYLKP